MVDAVDVARLDRQQVRALAVGVVRERIEEAHRRSRSSLVMTISSTSTDSSISIHAWTMPGPNGPSRRSVGGTMSQPLASDTR